MTVKTIGLVGARGFTGRELIRLISQRDDLDLVFASSREFAGRPVAEMAPEADASLMFEALGPDDMALRSVDAVILALPNGTSDSFVAAINKARPETIIVDLSADYRFDPSWVYGLPEIYGRDALKSATRISNPGCYATAGQLAIAPVRKRLSGPAHVFGVSGYSGAGTTPSRKNDVEALRDNFMPYALSGHIHEKEMRRHLGCELMFTPHVAAFFRGLVVTTHLSLKASITRDELIDLYSDFYAGESLIKITSDIPEVRDGADQNGAEIGGFDVSENGHDIVIVSTLDNLLKGAAVQALQNLVLALDLES